ncbi:MAG: hypothetical protein FWD73_11760 [Polyangiaceae bacterium]|nr:hypothetical protein [Polyangiaceae bacterium]
MSPDKLEKLMVQILSEVRDLRQNTVTSWQLKTELEALEARLEAKIDGVYDNLDAKIEDLTRNMKFTQLAVLETSVEVKRIAADHASRLDRLEAAS